MNAASTSNSEQPGSQPGKRKRSLIVPPTPAAAADTPTPVASAPTADPAEPPSLPPMFALRVRFASDVMMASIQANFARKDFLGMSLDAAAEFAVNAADELIAALIAPKEPK